MPVVKAAWPPAPCHMASGPCRDPLFACPTAHSRSSPFRPVALAPINSSRTLSFTAIDSTIPQSFSQQQDLASSYRLRRSGSCHVTPDNVAFVALVSPSGVSSCNIVINQVSTHNNKARKGQSKPGSYRTPQDAYLFGLLPPHHVRIGTFLSSHRQSIRTRPIPIYNPSNKLRTSPFSSPLIN
jgi:hypothetical protein